MRTKKAVSVLVLVVLALTLTGCVTIKAGAHYDETNDFGRYASFAWIDTEPMITGAGETGIIVSPLTRLKIQEAIRAGFENLGYRYVDEAAQADFVIAYTIGTRQEVSVRSYPDAYYGTWGWHVQGSRYYVNEIQAHNYTKGTLGVDVFDRVTKKPVWHGYAEKTITTDDRNDPMPAIEAGVGKMLASFPR